MWVVKLGGSLSASPELPAWLDALARTRAVLVPGGGPFADAVRHAQARWRFGAQAAHDMAILAMQQYGRMLAALQPALATAFEPAELAAPRAGAALWLPQPDTLNAAGVPPSWNITSDSLAAWLAREVGATNLLLIKSAAPLPRPEDAPEENAEERGRSAPRSRNPLGPWRSASPSPSASASNEISCEWLIERGWIDPAFRDYGALGDFRSWVCGLRDHERLPKALESPRLRFTQVNFSVAA
jgi:hypothetical protein